MATTTEAVIRVLDEAQNSAASHPKLLTILSTLYQKTENSKSFFEAFFPVFSNVLLVYKREPAAERVVAFVSKFAASVAPVDNRGDSDYEESESDGEVETSFLSLLIDKLLALHKAKDKAVRFRVCQMIARLVSSALEMERAVSPRGVESIQEVMLQRLRDKIPVVRVHAVLAVEYLQSGGSDCPVTSVLLEMMAKDSSPDVRKCIINKIALSDASVTAMIERTRDVKEAIRYSAFGWLATKCSIRNFTISRRIQMLRNGLNDTSELVLSGCVNGLLRKWTLECNDGDFISLLSKLDVESFADVCELAMVKLFDKLNVEDLVTSMCALLAASNAAASTTPLNSSLHQTTPRTRGSVTPSKATTPSSMGESHTPSESAPPTSGPKVLSGEFMGCEEVFYWSCLCRYLHRKGKEGEEGLDKLIPTLSEFCDYIQRYVEEVLVIEEEIDKKLQSQFITEQLCSMLAAFDLSDEVGKDRLARLVCELLQVPGFPTPLIGPLLQLQTKLWPQDSVRIERLVEVIAELRQPSTLAGGGEGRGNSAPPLSTTLLEESHLSANLSFLDLQDDPDTLLKCLTITCELLKCLRRRKLDDPILLTLSDSLLFPCIQNENPFVRDMALHCLGLAALLDLGIARNHILLFLQVSQVDHESVQATALKVVFDLLHVYGFEAFNITSSTAIPDSESGGGVEEDSQPGQGDREKEEEEGEGHEEEGENYITQRLLNIMASFLEGESILLREIAGGGICKLLLSQRILSEKLLAKLLLLWYNPVTEEETALRSILGLFFPTFAAQDRNCRLSLSEVYLPVLRMILEAPPTSPLAAINTSNLSDFVLQLTKPTTPSEESVHNSLALSLCNELLADPEATADVRTYSRTLSLLQLNPTPNDVADLQSLLEQVMCFVSDKTSIRYLNKFKATINQLLPTPQVQQQSSDTAPPLEGPEGTSTQQHGPDQEIPNHVGDPIMSHPHHASPPQAPPPVTNGGTTRPRRHRKAAAKNDVTIKGGRGRGKGRRKKIIVAPVSSSDDEEEEESGSENIEPEDIAAQSKNTPSARVPRKVPQSMVNGDMGRSSSEDSDDSIVGEHSPFVKHVAPRSQRKSVMPLQPLQYSDDDDN